jgi:hypothetical protein
MQWMLRAMLFLGGRFVRDGRVSVGHNNYSIHLMNVWELFI